MKLQRAILKVSQHDECAQRSRHFDPSIKTNHFKTFSTVLVSQENKKRLKVRQLVALLMSQLLRWNIYLETNGPGRW